MHALKIKKKRKGFVSCFTEHPQFFYVIAMQLVTVSNSKIIAQLLKTSYSCALTKRSFACLLRLLLLRIYF